MIHILEAAIVWFLMAGCLPEGESGWKMFLTLSTILASFSAIIALGVYSGALS